MMKPWREVVAPHPDVLSSSFQQAEFAADISAMDKPNTPQLYRDAATFFQRTFITEGMRLLLMQVACRLNGMGGEPVIQLQTAFGGGKTHTMLAVYHLARRECPLAELTGIPSLLDEAGLMDVPRASIAILDGSAHGPDQVMKRGSTEIRTLWGHLAWQLGGAEAFELVRQSDLSGTSPGKEALAHLLGRYAPCVVLVDELVTYVRQFAEGAHLAGGSYNSNLSFIQALTEAVKLVPNAVLLASLPESITEVGDARAKLVLAAVEKVFGRVQALWKPVAAEEGFEIVRRRLFEDVKDTATRDAVSRAFARTYVEERTKLPSETQEMGYQDRLVRAYPIHPEVFERLYEDWSTLDGFQRTRGVLTLMARVIQRLWKDQNNDLLILPGSLPLYDSGARNELTRYLPQGWDAVFQRDIEGDGAETTALDLRETRFGAVYAARRVARTIFLGGAPSSGGTKHAVRGIDRARVLLGCLQPGNASAVFSDALDRLADRLHYLNVSGDRTQDTTRYWFDTRANLRREMEDRKSRFDDARDVQPRVAELLGKLVANRGPFEGVHVFIPHSDVPDDVTLRLVVLPSSRAYSKQEPQSAVDAALEYVKSNGSKPRFRGNRLVFLAADTGTLARLRDAVRTTLAWVSIVADFKSDRLVIDNLQSSQAMKELEATEAIAQRAVRECFRWVLCPVMQSSTDREPQIEACPLNAAGTSFASELERVCSENELVIKVWSPVHLRNRLRELYWKDGRTSVRALSVWEDIQKFLYLPRLQNRGVFEQVVLKGAAGTDFWGSAYGERDGGYEGFRFGDGNIQIDNTLLLIDPEAAKAYQTLQALASEPSPRPSQGDGATSPVQPSLRNGGVSERREGTSQTSPTRAVSFYGSVDVNAATAKMSMVTLAEEIIAVLASDPHAEVKVTVEINTQFAQGAPDHVKRAVTENASALGFKVREWG